MSKGNNWIWSWKKLRLANGGIIRDGDEPLDSDIKSFQKSLLRRIGKLERDYYRGAKMGMYGDAIEDFKKIIKGDRE